jgi:hypothetical protein
MCVYECVYVCVCVCMSVCVYECVCVYVHGCEKDNMRVGEGEREESICASIWKSRIAISFRKEKK